MIIIIKSIIPELPISSNRRDGQAEYPTTISLTHHALVGVCNDRVTTEVASELPANICQKKKRCNIILLVINLLEINISLFFYSVLKLIILNYLSQI